MRAVIAFLAIGLVATNVFWAVVHFQADDARDAPEADTWHEEIAALRNEIARLRDEVGRASRTAPRRLQVKSPPPVDGGGADPALAPPAAASPADSSRAAAVRGPEPSPTAPTESAPSGLISARVSVEAVNRAKADILQIEDPARREQGLLTLAQGMRSADAHVANAALLSLAGIRDVSYDKRRFRADVLHRLTDANATVRNAAAFALLQVERAPDDLDRLLTAAEQDAVPPSGLLFSALNLNERRAEGRLASLWVKALSAANSPRAAADTANYLRGMWLAPEVEDAVVDAWRRHPPLPGDGIGLWAHILGQLQPAPRESRVRAIFELMASSDAESARQLTSRVMTNSVDETARKIAADLAIASLSKASDSSMRRTLLDIVAANGSREHAPALRAFSGNSMVREDLRNAGRAVADVLDRGR